jgi:rhodanese-related sulfurtransferase
LIPEITPLELDAWRKDVARAAPFVVDVREPWEHEKARIEGSTLIPMREIPARLAELPEDAEIVVMCHHGTRSAQVVQWLARNGFERTHNLAGGIDAWSRLVDPAVPRY